MINNSKDWSHRRAPPGPHGPQSLSSPDRQWAEGGTAANQSQLSESDLKDFCLCNHVLFLTKCDAKFQIFLFHVWKSKFHL